MERRYSIVFAEARHAFFALVRIFAMRSFGSLFLIPVVSLLLVIPARASEDAKPAAKTGGNYAVEIIKDQPYYEAKDADTEKHRLDLYLPQGQKGYPVLFFVHGGSSRAGAKNGFPPPAPIFALNGPGASVSSNA